MQIADVGDLDAGGRPVERERRVGSRRRGLRCSNEEMTKILSSRSDRDKVNLPKRIGERRRPRVLTEERRIGAGLVVYPNAIAPERTRILVLEIELSREELKRSGLRVLDAGGEVRARRQTPASLTMIARRAASRRRIGEANDADVTPGDRASIDELVEALPGMHIRRIVNLEIPRDDERSRGGDQEGEVDRRLEPYPLRAGERPRDRANLRRSRATAGRLERERDDSNESDLPELEEKAGRDEAPVDRVRD